MNKLTKVVHNKNLPIILILMICVSIGFFIFQDFGVSWDEPEYYQYAESTIKAYSIKDLLTGQYSLESTFGPADLRYYGPSFLIIGKGITSLLSLIFPFALYIDIWHLTIYLFFLFGVFLFYKLVLRLTSILPAIITSILLISQPVLFGNAWINPKDIPFMVFFMGTLYFGLVFSDHLMVFFFDWKENRTDWNNFKNPWLPFYCKSNKVLKIFGSLLIITSLSLVVFSSQLKHYISKLILGVNIDSAATLFDKFFISQVRGLSEVPLTYYANKALTLLDRTLPIFGIIALLFFAILVFIHRYPRFFSSLFVNIYKNAAQVRNCYQVYPSKLKLVLSFVAACLFLASATATRIIGPLAGFLIIVIWIIKFKKKSPLLVLIYGIITFILFYIQWPYIWQKTIDKLVFVLQHMSNNPVGVNVLYFGTTYDSRELPFLYFPGLVGITTTEPALVLSIVGLLISIVLVCFRKKISLEWLVIAGWLLIPLGYILILKPPMYDNYRHFLFVIPALLLFAALAIHHVFCKVQSTWFKWAFSLLLVFPGIIALIQTHPYEYSYYNSLVGGANGAENKYELDYWLTCYKALGEKVQANELNPLDVYVDLNPDLVTTYSFSKMTVYPTNTDTYTIGGLIFLPHRWGHHALYEQYPIAYSIELEGVDLCIARRVQ